MKIALIFTLLVMGFSFQAHSSDFHTRVMDTYTRTDSNYDLECYYSRNKSWKLISPVGETVRDGDSLRRNFSVESEEGIVPMVFTVKREDNLISYEIILNNIHANRNKVSKRDFYLSPLKDKDFEARFETTKIFCSINFAYALPFVLEGGDYHFSVHPERPYDWQNRLTPGIERLLNDKSYQSVIFLENGNRRGNLVNIHNFFDNKAPTLPVYPFSSELENVPSDIPLIVSPAGNNRFKIEENAREINVKFTGGNHNYCVWNVARHVLEDLMQSKSNARINFNYPMDLLVAQARGVEGMRMNFGRRVINRSNLLKDLLTTPEEQQRYHEAYIQYFIKFLAEEYKAMYKSYTVLYSAPGYHKEVVIPGNGHRDLVVKFNYH